MDAAAIDACIEDAVAGERARQERAPGRLDADVRERVIV
jgi:hypothetical protein